MNKIKDFRKQHNLTQRKLAELLRVDIKTVQRWESGERVPHPIALMLIDTLNEGAV